MRILYLHGFASGPSSRKATFFQDRFAGHGVEMETPDLSAGDFEHLTISGQLDVIHRTAGSDVVSLMGSSMGGYLAALYAAQHREQVERLVLLAPAFAFLRRWPQSLGAAQLNEWRTTGWLPVFHYSMQRMTRIGYRLLEDGARHPDFPDFVQPALIYHGRADDVVPASCSQEFVRSHPNARLELVDSGHELTDVLGAMWEGTRRFLLAAR